MIEESSKGQDPNLNYYEQYCKICNANNALLNELKQLVNEKNDLKNKFERL